MSSLTDPNRTVVFDSSGGALMRRLELNFRGVDEGALDPWSLALLRRREFVLIADGMVTMTKLGAQVFTECDVVRAESETAQCWMLADARLAELGIELTGV